ncbi:MAG: hypothetical protein HKN06_04220 [Gammaproteobacteria bacterium]|nr:hypothetical protein [Gammaproteobacteria bacterium]
MRKNDWNVTCTPEFTGLPHQNICVIRPANYANMNTARFNLIFEGEVEPGHVSDDVRHALEELFNFDAELQAALSLGQPVFLGESMDAATANTFKQALAGAGARTRLQAANTEDETDLTDRRSAQRRLRAKRRTHARPVTRLGLRRA